ncbi:hypothetical protein Z949_1747 [Sulfitobacter guttiformis KCTC 32187]|nr:hypothetical protein Z949_1747 [Sulfitobacter guttiformis KCTC 32187]
MIWTFRMQSIFFCKGDPALMRLQGFLGLLKALNDKTI